MKCIRVFLIIFSALAVILISVCTKYNHTYDTTIAGVLSPSVIYDSEIITCPLNSDYYSLIAIPSKKLYFRKVPDKSEAIEITIPDRAKIYIFSHTEDSILMRYEPYKGIKLNYVLNGYSFNKHLEILYDITNNKVFQQDR